MDKEQTPPLTIADMTPIQAFNVAVHCFDALDMNASTRIITADPEEDRPDGCIRWAASLANAYLDASLNVAQARLEEPLIPVSELSDPELVMAALNALGVMHSAFSQNLCAARTHGRGVSQAVMCASTLRHLIGPVQS